jgi:hypothetical protein
MEKTQQTTYEVTMQKDGQYQVIVRHPNAIDEHVSNFKTNAGAEAWVAAQPKVKVSNLIF